MRLTTSVLAFALWIGLVIGCAKTNQYNSTLNTLAYSLANDASAHRNTNTNRGKAVPKNQNNRGHPAGVTARCAGGTYSYSQHGQGTCSHHGGVA